jgi:Fe2+ transport system protein B
MMEPPPYSMPNMQNMLRGFVAQGEVFVDKEAAGILLSRIKSEAQRNVPVVAPQVDRNVNEAMKLISSKLGPLFDDAMASFDVPLPKLLRSNLKFFILIIIMNYANSLIMSLQHPFL